MTESDLTTDTLARCVRRILLTTFQESNERFAPERAALLSLGEDSEQIKVETCTGFRETPCALDQLALPLAQASLTCKDTVRELRENTVILCIPIKRPLKKSVAALLYFENPPHKLNFQQGETVAIESLAARAGVEIALLHKRLITQKRRVLPTTEQRENWTGVRRAGLEAFQAGIMDMALSFLERARDMAEEWGPCLELAASLNDFGQVLMAGQQIQEAQHQFERAMSMLELAGLARHSLSISLFNNLGAALHKQERSIEAKEIYQMGLEIASEQEKESRLTPAILANLGVISQEVGDFPEAQIWLQQAALSSARIFGDDHTYTVRCQEKLQSLHS